MYAGLRSRLKEKMKDMDGGRVRSCIYYGHEREPVDVFGEKCAMGQRN